MASSLWHPTRPRAHPNSSHFHPFAISVQSRRRWRILFSDSFRPTDTLFPRTRLYQAPVESDIKGKPAPKSPPTRARSTIRRSRRSRVDVPSAVPSRASRRRLLGAGADSHWTPWDSLTSEDTPAAAAAAPSRSVDNNASANATSQSPTWGAGGGSERAQGALRDMVGRMGPMMNDRVLALFGERWAQLHAGSNPSPARDQSTPDQDEHEPSPPLETSYVDGPRLARRRGPRFGDVSYIFVSIPFQSITIPVCSAISSYHYPSPLRFLRLQYQLNIV